MGKELPKDAASKITLREFAELRQDLGDTIRAMIDTFEEKTGATIKRVDVSRTLTIDGTSKITGVTVDAAIGSI